jgi:sulfoxide reductase catalytic subunit YedY
MEVGKPGRYALEDFMKPYQLEERIYRLRCVEAWSMVIPWIGFSGASAQAGRADFQAVHSFETLQDPKSMPGSAPVSP